MTIIVGLRSANGVVLASDSLVSTGIGINRTRDRKLYDVSTEHCGTAAVGGAGHTAFIKQAVDRIKEGLQNTPTTKRDIESCCSRVYSDVWREYIAERVRELGWDGDAKPDMGTVADFKERIADLEFGFLLGVRLTSSARPELFVSAGRGLTESVDHYEAIGTGAALALYVLQKAWPQKRRVISLSFLRQLALYVVDEAIKYADGCGGTAHVWSISRSGELVRMEPSERRAIRKWNYLLVRHKP